MKATAIHQIYISSMMTIVILVTLYLGATGIEYYNIPLEERFYHPNHHWLKPSGTFGHGLGIVGTLMILFGVTIYIARKRYNFLSKYIRLKYLLEFHIFLCVLGPILIVFHTAFKIGGVVSVAFWCMLAVVLSGVIGRFIYIQIPRTIEGRALSLNELTKIRSDMINELHANEIIDESTKKSILAYSSGNRAKGSMIKNYFQDRKAIADLNQMLKSVKRSKKERSKVLKLIRKEISLANKMERLQTMQDLFKYWHVAHLPFALIMLIIVVIHVGVTLAFGYKWIF